MQYIPQFSESPEKALKRTMFLVEANSFEQFSLWERWSNTSLYKLPDYKQITWEEINPCPLVKIGKLGKRPVCLSLRWARLEGVLVCFWYMCSQVTDSAMAEKWLDKHFTGTYDRGSRRAVCDAMNFAHCIHALKELKEKQLEVAFERAFKI